MRVAAGIEYDGSAYAGWQSQKHAPSVQDVVERALSKVADHDVQVVCAGRTDAGVHAVGQVVHFDTDALREMHSWVLGTTVNLPPDVAMRWARPADEGFHARFSAVSRSYRYVILNRKVRPALLRDRVSWQHDPLDAGRMAEAAGALVGEHDFSSYRAVACQARHAVRRVELLNVFRQGDYVCIDIIANAFLHHMVRNIAGVLMAIGRGDRPVSWSAEVLAARDRTAGGITAPAAGLYLVGVNYPHHLGLPQPPRPPVFG